MNFSETLVKRFFSSYPHLTNYYIAYSGGLDSTVLLHAMCNAKLPIHAVHINHHLQIGSDAWQQHCETTCKQWKINISVKHAEIQKSPQKSLEDVAREARYKLLEKFVDEKSAIVTAHHQDDLAETILLQLLRGAGPAGLAAMPVDKKFAQGTHLRPLLSVTRTELQNYAESHELEWVEDPSNSECDYDRNYLRKEVMPKLLQRWPAALKTLSRSAQLQSEALSCLQELARIDFLSAGTDQEQTISVRVLQELSDERIKNVLRYWIQSHQMRTPSRKTMQQIVSDVVRKKEIETTPLQTWKDGEIRRYQDQLYLMRPMSPHDPSQVLRWKIDQPLLIKSLNRTLKPSELKENQVVVPDGVKELVVRFREGGERLKPIGQNQHRSLKNLLNEAGVPPWERSRIPLLYHQDQLISVLGYWNVELLCETS